MQTPFKHTTLRTRFFLMISFLMLALSGTTSAFTQEMKKDDSLYQDLGQREGIAKIVADFVPMLLDDVRIKQFFTKVKKEEFSEHLTNQFCELAGGPCRYTGKDMYEAHEGMKIGNAQFNAVAEDLQMAMEKNNVASSVANRLVAKLAPMQRPIVSK